MGKEIEALAVELLKDRGGRKPLVMGRVTSLDPFRVVAEGTSQEADSLLANAALALEELKEGDTLVLWPIEDRQRYVILCKVVSV